MFAARLWRVTGTPGMRCAAQSLRPPLFSRRHFHPIRLASTSPNQAPVSSQPRQSIERARPTRPPKQATHKPPRRRMEAASLPLRNETAPTRGPILQCIAHTTAERYDLSALAVTLRRLGVRWDEVPEGDPDRAFVIQPWKGRGGAERLIRGKDVRPEAEDEGDDLGFEYGERGEILVFHSGSFVTWGLTEEEGRAFLRNVIRTKGSRVEHGRLADADCEVEEADFVVDPEAQTHILGNLILLGRPPELSTFSSSSPALASLLARYTLSLSLTRSSSLSVLENRLDKHIASVSLLPRALEVFGEQPLGRRDVIRKAGELMTLRMAVNTRGGGLEDTPEFYWSEPELEQYFDAIANEFEMKERVETINKKIDYAQEVQSTLRALLTEASGHRMEIIIILLIAVEVVFLLIREGPELYEELVHPVMGRVKDVLGPLTKPSSAPRVRGVAPAPEPVTSAPEAEANDEPRRLV
ncbi:uncharacterized protein CcaverHIS019_0105230 [Cutaneotrichosporon cavernicola]|uniref:DUF155 domain-containing protein n=1 Tax=Cutaneotrichosporon cavernicola TaxID=279322 RepID=A0AA48I4N4_9TREE|nr:uncharacterized protein CcaverHIS019_0105230 [Cutaneotrichosporon cavernicola]BEI87805.1 hypothetical protein CcaverHIS019_0105230 [Cutaneotrichosporon cavernicola]BEI95579.1 hypothetical protein CcaverHIS631_0105280 [Cutaneotrichosporon cavernicola]BEJ03353.1 hypothetical protein CcaverHIS641_0105280 [Cutaneotrichosporon cavernicola]